MNVSNHQHFLAVKNQAACLRNQENIFIQASFSHCSFGSDLPQIQQWDNNLMATVRKVGKVKPGGIWPFCLFYLYFLYSKAQGDT